MRRVLQLLVITLLLSASTQAYGQRYLTEVFTGVTLTSGVMYAANIGVLTGAPQLDTLYMNVYEPATDTLTERPLVMIAHTGSFLPPPLNGATTGNMMDSAVVEMANQFAKRGYVVATFGYRLGWNPVGTQEERTGTLLNAAYRGIQDARACIRFFKMNTATMGNTFGVDTSKIAMGGLGTGGYMSDACATLDKYAEINLAKFIDPNTSSSYIDTSLSGNLWGTNNRPLNVANYPSYSSDFQFAWNCGGALADSTWLEAGDVPMVGFHCPNDPFAPYKYGAVIVPTTGDFVVNVSGTHDIIRQANQHHSNNSIIENRTYSDPFTAAANMKNDGWEGLFPFYRPTPESAPWEWWNPSHPNDSLSKLTNPTMSPAKGMAYIDTIMGYLNPRMVCVLGLPGCAPLVGIENELPAGTVSIYPNPSNGSFAIKSDGHAGKIEEVILYNFAGRAIYRKQNVNDFELKLEVDNLPSGMYIVKTLLEGGVLNKKIIIE